MRHGITLNQANSAPSPVTERRRTPLLRVVWAALFGGDTHTMGLVLLRGQVILAFTVLVLNARIMATPPPLFQGNVLLLQAWFWALLILASTGWQIYAKAKCSLLWSCVAAFCSAGVCGGLLGPIYLRALSFFVPMLCFWIAQTAQAALLIWAWKKEKQMIEQLLREQAQNQDGNEPGAGS